MRPRVWTKQTTETVPFFEVMHMRPSWLIAIFCNAFFSAAHAAPFAYVSNEGSASVSVIDTATDKVVSTIKIGEKPRGAAP